MGPVLSLWEAWNPRYVYPHPAQQDVTAGRVGSGLLFPAAQLLTQQPSWEREPWTPRPQQKGACEIRLQDILVI